MAAGLAPRPATHLLHAAAQLILNGKVLSALHGRHEARECALLARKEIDSSSLHVDELIHETRHTLLIRAVAAQYFGAETNPNVALLLVKRTTLRLDLAVHFAEPPHLIGVEAQPLLDDGRHALAQALLERLASRQRRISCGTLSEPMRRRESKPERQQNQCSRTMHQPSPSTSGGSGAGSGSI
jgi:hypothetical protein